MRSAKYGSLWLRDELILALYLYCQIPFAKTKANNPEVIRLAKLLGRTPASVARKLGNFGAFDPLLAQQGISGLVHFSKADRSVWDEFRHRWETLVEESNRLLAVLNAPSSPIPDPGEADEEIQIISKPSGPSERKATVSVRLLQSFFRRTVLASYDGACCVCGIDLRPLLVASHIVPWSANEAARTEPKNGLCLCALHDRAFDRGLICVTASLEILVSSAAHASRQDFTKVALTSYHTQSIRRPRRFEPDAKFLEWHRKNIFRS